MKFASAITYPDFEDLNDWIKSNNINPDSNTDLISKIEISTLIQNEVDSICKQFVPHEAIKKTRLTSDEWALANNLLSQTLKIKVLRYYQKNTPILLTKYTTKINNTPKRQSVSNKI